MGSYDVTTQTVEINCLDFVSEEEQEAFLPERHLYRDENMNAHWLTTFIHGWTHCIDGIHKAYNLDEKYNTAIRGLVDKPELLFRYGYESYDREAYAEELLARVMETYVDACSLVHCYELGNATLHYSISSALRYFFDACGHLILLLKEEYGLTYILPELGDFPSHGLMLSLSETSLQRWSRICASEHFPLAQCVIEEYDVDWFALFLASQPPLRQVRNFFIFLGHILEHPDCIYLFSLLLMNTDRYALLRDDFVKHGKIGLWQFYSENQPKAVAVKDDAFLVAKLYGELFGMNARVDSVSFRDLCQLGNSLFLGLVQKALAKQSVLDAVSASSEAAIIPHKYEMMKYLA